MIDIETLLFDLDGTLVDSWPAMHNGFAYTLEKLKLPPQSFDEVLSHVPKGMIDLWQLVLKSTDQTYVNQAIEIYKAVFSDRYSKTIEAYPGVAETLAYFEKKQKVVVTNGLADLSWSILRHAGLDGFIADLMGGDDIGCLKPMACPLDTEMEKIDAEKERAMMVGDMTVDIEAGKAAGVYTCAVSYGIGRMEDLKNAQPDFIVNDMRELKDIVAL